MEIPIATTVSIREAGFDEYWDNEKRRWPQRQHYAVLVAESITRRFFNVIQLLSQTIPIIAVQVNMIESAGNKSLHFSKILDTYEDSNSHAMVTSLERIETFSVRLLTTLKRHGRNKNSEQRSAGDAVPAA